MIEGQCPACRRVYKVDDRYAGMTGRCKACGAAIRIPGPLDEGLDGLPDVAPQGQAEPAAAPAPEAPQPAAAAAAPPAAAPGVHPGDEFLRPRDARARFEPSEGPTPMRGPWLREDAEAPRAPERPQAESPAPAAPARSALAERFITPVTPESAATHQRPPLLRVAAAALGLLALGLATHVVSAGAWGKAAAGLAIALGLLAIARLWAARWDGLLAGLLLCLCAAGAALVPSEVPAAGRALATASAITLLLLLLAALRRSGREYFMA